MHCILQNGRPVLRTTPLGALRGPLEEGARERRWRRETHVRVSAAAVHRATQRSASVGATLARYASSQLCSAAACRSNSRSTVAAAPCSSSSPSSAAARRSAAPSSATARFRAFASSPSRGASCSSSCRCTCRVVCRRSVPSAVFQPSRRAQCTVHRRMCGAAVHRRAGGVRPLGYAWRNGLFDQVCSRRREGGFAPGRSEHGPIVAAPRGPVWHPPAPCSRARDGWAQLPAKTLTLIAHPRRARLLHAWNDVARADHYCPPLSSVARAPCASHREEGGGETLYPDDERWARCVRGTQAAYLRSQEGRYANGQGVPGAHRGGPSVGAGVGRSAGSTRSTCSARCATCTVAAAVDGCARWACSVAHSAVQSPLLSEPIQFCRFSARHA